MADSISSKQPALSAVPPPPLATASQTPDERFVSETIASLTSESHLQRDRALTQLQASDPLQSSWYTLLQKALFSHLIPTHSWYILHASTLALSHILPFTLPASPDPLSVPFQHVYTLLTDTLIAHPEPRVRSAATTLIETVASLIPERIIPTLAPVLLQRVDDSLAIDPADRLAEAARIARQVLDANAATAKQRHNLVHETEGWRDLETTLVALTALVRGVSNARSSTADRAVDDANGADVASGEDGTGHHNEGDTNTRSSLPLNAMLHCVARARNHANRFVREAALKLLDVCAHACFNGRLRGIPMDIMDNSTLITQGLPSLLDGLQDNWSQVRYAASVATRTILKETSGAQRDALYDTLLPRMCLNRHYVAEGVRNYSQETWITVMGPAGRGQLAKRLGAVLDFYDSQTCADNHAVREASCQALGEVIVRLEPEVVREHAGRVARSLVQCFKDESWPVRDHACRALASVVRAFPQQVEAEGGAQEDGVLTQVRELFVTHLADNIPSVREHCANAFVTACLAFEDDHPVMGIVGAAQVARELMQHIGRQREDSDKATVRDTQFGASTRLAGSNGNDNDANGGGKKGHADADAAHTNQVMYSCGSLAPKLRRGGGCLDHGFVRAREGWEECEGGLLVWRALLPNGVVGRAKAAGQMDGDWGGLLEVAVASGVTGASKQFQHKGKFLEAVLLAVTEAVGRNVEVGDERLAGVLRVIKESGRDDSEAVRRAGRECRRVLCGQAGLSKVATVERTL